MSGEGRPAPQGEPDRPHTSGQEPGSLEDREPETPDEPEVPDEQRAPVEHERDQPVAGPAAPAQGGPEAQDEDIPVWIAEVVVMAEHVRAMLRLQAPLIGVGLLALLVAGWAGAPALPWMAGAMALAAGCVALRHCGAPEGSGLRPGAWAGLVLLVLDLALTPWGLAVYLGLRLAGAAQPLLEAGACAVTGALVGVGALVVGLLVEARRPRLRDGGLTHRAARPGAGSASPADLAGRGALRPQAVGAIVVVTGALLWLFSVHLTWWWVGGAALVAEAGNLVALRVGAWAHRR